MFPTISLGPFSISSYGVFLAAGFLFGIFLVWRLSRAWDLNEEKVLDLCLLTFLGGLLGARIYFILENFSFFGTDPSKWLFIQKYGGFSFWGAILGGFLTLNFFSKKFKINFLQALDFAAVGLLGGLIFSDLGCFLAGCNLGVPSKLFFATPMVGAISKRIPLQLLEAALLTFALFRIWRRATHFHIQGTIVSILLFTIFGIRLVLEPIKADHAQLIGNIILSALGITFFYRVTKRNLYSDMKAYVKFLISLKSSDAREALMIKIYKSWYNYKVGLGWKFRQIAKILRRINVYFSHKDSKYY